MSPRGDADRSWLTARALQVQAERYFEAWTARALPVGTPVLVTMDDGSVKEAVTRSNAWVSNADAGEPLVLLDIGRGGYQLLRVRTRALDQGERMIFAMIVAQAKKREWMRHDECTYEVRDSLERRGLVRVVGAGKRRHLRPTDAGWALAQRDPDLDLSLEPPK